MNYPEKLKIDDAIGICAPSCGIIKPSKLKKLEKAIETLKNMGYKIIETKSVRKQENGRSASPEQRAKEFMELLENDEVKLIIFATGGDFLCEMLDYLDFEKIKTLKPKWLQGYSDITGIEFLFNTILEIPSVYGATIKDYAMKPIHRSLIDCLEIERGKEIVQNSFELYEKEWTEDTENPCTPYNLTERVEWKNIIGGEKVVMQGRSLGGCLDSLQGYFATKYDNIKNYIEKHKEEGIIWFLECYEKSSSDIYRFLWQMKSAGYFKYCNGIIFGRPLFCREDYNISFNETVKEVLKDLKIPVICDADIGHVSPQMAILNGGILKISYENGKGKVETFFK